MKKTNLLLSAAIAGSLFAAPLFGAGTTHAATGYTVKDSDTLWKISVNQGITLQSLINANPQIANPNIIWAGMTINLPQKASAPAASAPAKTTTSTPAASNNTQNTTASVSSYAQQVASLVNTERSKNGLSPLTLDSALSNMALVKSKDMYNNNYFDHTSPTYGSPFNMMTSFGISYSYAGENIAKGQQTPQDVMTAWMNSQGHRANILNANYNKIGVAYYNGVWVQEFIKN
ncbi:CAP domain-containing protein [Gorillibacterium massiliense]|uniref:CAP domain-containing protein n=1 Tax=Gorillibacterium massiliense TaxID=1280390 RepID=UPI0004B5CA13|nr:CAP domain-containing protein [Gorillibacterium massiliense]